MNIRCFFGLHKWFVVTNILYKKRYCECCGKRQKYYHFAKIGGIFEDWEDI